MCSIHNYDDEYTFYKSNKYTTQDIDKFVGGRTYKGSGRGWGGTSPSVLNRVEKKKKPQRPHTMRKQQMSAQHDNPLRQKTSKFCKRRVGKVSPYIDSDPSDHYEFVFWNCSYNDDDDNWSYYSNCDDIQECKSPSDVWEVFNMPDADAIAFYERRDGLFPKVSFRETFTVLSNVLQEWVDIYSVDTYGDHFFNVVFGSDLVRFSDGRLVFTKQARVRATQIFNLNQFHCERVALRVKVAREKNKEYASQHSAMWIPYNSVDKELEIVLHPLLHMQKRLRTILIPIMNKHYHKYMQQRICTVMSYLHLHIWYQDADRTRRE